MALLSTNRTITTLGGVTRQHFLQQFGEKTGLVYTGTATSGGVDNLIDTTSLQSSQYSQAEWTGGWARISANTSSPGTSPEGDIRPIQLYDPDLGKVSVMPFFSGSVANGYTYELWKVNPKIVLDIIDRALENDLYVPSWTMLSEIDDFDMEASGTTTWTGANSTLAKVSVGSNRLAQSGKQYLQVTATAAGGYAKSGVLNVEANKSFHASAIVQCANTSSTAKLQVWDETHGNEILSYTSDRTYPVRLFFNWNSPAGCKQVSYRLISVNNGDITSWDEVVAFQLATSDIAIPWWVKKTAQCKGIFQHVPIGTASQQLWDTAMRGELDRRWDVYRSYGPGSPFRANCRVGFGTSWPLFMYGFRNESAYANDTVDLKFIDIPKMLACIAYKVYERASQPLVTGLLDSQNFKSMLQPLHDEWMILSQEEDQGLDEILQSDTPWMKYQDPRFSYTGGIRGGGF